MCVYMQAACLAKCNGANVALYRSGTFSLEEFRQAVIDTCTSGEEHLVVSKRTCQIMRTFVSWECLIALLLYVVTSCLDCTVSADMLCGTRQLWDMLYHRWWGGFWNVCWGKAGSGMLCRAAIKCLLMT
jgi:hypothetical protein